MARYGIAKRWVTSLPLAMLAASNACSSVAAPGGSPSSASGTTSGSGSGSSTSSGSGTSTSGAPTSGSSGGGADADANASEAGESADAVSEASSGDDGGVGPEDGATYPSPDAASYGGVGQLVLVPLQYTSQPVPPILAPDCPGDPTQGFTEYRDSFVIQRPYDLAAADRFSYENGIYTFWVLPTDKPHAMGNGTAPRTEARYSDMSTGEHIWTADVMFEAPLNDTCIMQIHNVLGAIAAYYRVIGGRAFNLGTGQTILTNDYNKWFNMKVYFNAQTLEVRTYVNNCLMDTHTAPHGTPYWYFKNGTYTCQATICKDHYKNIHLYERGSTDQYNVISKYP
jgi:hypothetical protein